MGKALIMYWLFLILIVCIPLFLSQIEELKSYESNKTKYPDFTYNFSNFNEKIIERNVTVYIQNHTVEYVNISTPCDCDPAKDSEYIINLIRQLKACEHTTYKNYSLNDCREELESMNRTLGECNKTLNEIMEVVQWN